ncbi:MAG: WG repeat-containing protein, partial [Cyanobacteria bacterium HKST-UBA02]|nr:WG repeat-containing protein [Cyanobacteria bacterium HKST-UBA02]
PLKLPTFFEPIKLSSCFYRRLKYGLVSSSGQWLVKPIYDSMFSLRDGMRIVELDGKYGFIDANGREIIKPVFPGVSNFNDGRAIASVDPTARVWDRQSSDPVNIVSDSLDLSSGVDPGTIEDSIKVLSKVVDIAPESANAYANRGRFYYQAGCYEGALSDFQKALERKPECKNFLYWRGCSYLKLKRWRAAEKDFLQLNPSLMAVDPSRKLNNWPFNLDRVYVFDSFPMTTESKLIIARAAQGRYEGFARRMFVASRAGAKVAPKVIESPEVNLARALSGYSHTDDVLFGRCGSDSLSLARREYIYPRGELDWSILSLEKCLSRLRRNTKPDKAVLEIIDSEHGRLLDMAVRSRQRRFELAGLESLLLKRCQAMESSIRGPNPHTFACFELAEYYADLGDPRAEEIYKSVLAPGEFSKLYIDHYAFYLSRLGRDSEANALFQDGNPTGIATRRYANFLAGHGMKGKIPQLLERSRKFNCSYSREIQAFKLPELPVPDKGTAEEYFELCKTANDFGQVDAANHYLEKSRVVGKDSNWQEMLSRYKRNYLPVERIPLEVVSLFFCVVESDMRHFDFEEPRNALLKCIKEAPEYPHPYAELVNLYTFVGSYSDAEALLKVGVKQHPNFVPLRMAAGKLYLDTGRKDKAVEAYKTALNLDPTVELAQREVKRLGK